MADVHHRVLGEAGDAQEGVDGLARGGEREARGAVPRHVARAVRQHGADVAAGGQAVVALAALRQEHRHHRVPHGHLLDMLPHALHHAGQTGQWTRRINNANAMATDRTACMCSSIYRRLEQNSNFSFFFSEQNKTGLKVNCGCLNVSLPYCFVPEDGRIHGRQILQKGTKTVCVSNKTTKICAWIWI